MGKNRVHSLDYLRGLMAFGIMVYHFSLWTGPRLNSETLLGKTGIYGVSVFYVLSGLTLYIVYNNRLSAANTGYYFIKRIFRIFPLLWLSVLLTLTVIGKKADFTVLALNLSGLFGFVAPGKYIAVASWSIGNELVFYMLFPLILLLKNKIRYAIPLFFIVSMIAGVYFAFNVLSEQQLLRLQWNSYVNPLNQVVLFSGGVLIGELFSGKNFPRLTGPIIMIVSVLAYIWFPVGGDQSYLITGYTRVVYVMISFALTISFLITDFRIGKAGRFVLSRLGEASYSVYLLHPVVFHLMKNHSEFTNPVLFMITGIFTTLLLATLVYRFVETPFISLGQRIITNLKKVKNPVIVRS